MASQNLNVGTTANDGGGMSLRQAFINTRKMFADMYGITYTSDTQDISGSTFSIDHAQLSNSYTELSPLGTGSSFALNFDSACTFTATMDNNATFTLSNAQQGQVIDLIVSGNFTVTFAETGSTFNKVGSSSYDGSTTNIIQIMCTDDTDGAKIYHFAVGTYASSTTA